MESFWHLDPLAQGGICIIPPILQFLKKKNSHLKYGYS
jgi:hypothetical protein